MTGSNLSNDANTKKTNQPASSARTGRSSLDWQVQPGQDAHPVVESVVSELHRLRQNERPFTGGAARAMAVQALEGETLLTILAFGDEAFGDLVLLMQSLKFCNVLPSEDPATGLDAVFIPASAISAKVR